MCTKEQNLFWNKFFKDNLVFLKKIKKLLGVVLDEHKCFINLIYYNYI